VRIAALFVVAALAATPVQAADADGDGLDDAADNCSQTQNTSQCDTDKDGYGNHCDADFDEDFDVDAGDFAIFNADTLTGGDGGTGTDLNCDGYVDASDFPSFNSAFISGAPPGPGFPCAGTAPCVRPPNILVIIADDVGVDMIGAYATEPTAYATAPAARASTPEIDGLAKKGVLFRNVWSAPVCAPTRATIQTGRYSYRTKVYTGNGTLPETEVTVAEVLNGGGANRFDYATAVFGKWGLAEPSNTNAPVVAGYDFFQGDPDATLGTAADAYWSWSKHIACPTCAPIVQPITHHATLENVDDAVDWIAEHRGQPWLLFLSFNAAHSPYHDPYVMGRACADNASCYTMMVEHMDTQIADFTERSNLDLNSTTVFFVGDNGNPLNTVRGKGRLYQGGIHVPLIIAGYGVEGADPATIRMSDALVNTTDLFKTMLDLAGVTPGASVPHDSHSLLPILQGSVDQFRHYAYAEDNNFGVKAIQNRAGYKLMVFQETPVAHHEYQLFWLKHDEKELHNLVETVPCEEGDLPCYGGYRPRLIDPQPDTVPPDPLRSAALEDLHTRIGDRPIYAVPADPAPPPGLAPANLDLDADGVAP
jgi:arylsulfatase A-like enzyme